MTLTWPWLDTFSTPDPPSPSEESPNMNTMTAIAAPARAIRRSRNERRLQVQVPGVERRRQLEEQHASHALAAQLRGVREHSYLSAPPAMFRVF